MVNLLLADNILEFLDERVRRAKYSEVNDIPKLINLLQKYIPLPSSSLSLSLFSPRAHRYAIIHTFFLSLTHFCQASTIIYQSLALSLTHTERERAHATSLHTFAKAFDKPVAIVNLSLYSLSLSLSLPTKPMSHLCQSI